MTNTPGRFALHPQLTLRDVATQLPFTYTGADLYALCSDAMLKAITRRATSVDTKVKSLNRQRADASPPLPSISVAYFFDHLAMDEDTDVVVSQQDFEDAMRELVPSVSVKELEHYDRVRRVFEKGEDGSDQKGQKKEGHEALKSLMSKANGTGKASQQHDEDDFVSRTEGLSLNENGKAINGAPVGSVAKGKGKAQYFDVHDFGFGKATDGDEELYSP